MKKIFFTTLLLLTVNCLLPTFSSAQSNLTTEQQQAVEVEKQNLKGGKISYEEFQKRYDAIVSSKPQTIAPNTPKDSSVATTPSIQTTPNNQPPATNNANNAASTQTPVPNNTQQNKYNQPTQRKEYKEYFGPTAGDELIKFTNQFYTGLGLYVAASFVLVVGAAVASPGLAVLGALATIPATIILLKSFSHIKKAGKIMNLNERNSR